MIPLGTAVIEFLWSWQYARNYLAIRLQEVLKLCSGLWLWFVVEVSIIKINCWTRTGFSICQQKIRIFKTLNKEIDFYHTHATKHDGRRFNSIGVHSRLRNASCRSVVERRLQSQWCENFCIWIFQSAFFIAAKYTYSSHCSLFVKFHFL